MDILTGHVIIFEVIEPVELEENETVGKFDTDKSESDDVFTVPLKDTQIYWWSHKIGGFFPRSSHAVVAVGNVIYSFGGMNGDGHPSYSADGPLDIFVLKVNELDSEMAWEKLPIENNASVPRQRDSHSAVAYKEFVFIFGGLDSEKEKVLTSNLLLRFNTQTLKWDRPKVTGDVVGARAAHSAAVIGNEMVIFGGMNYDIQLTTDLHSLNLDTFRWSTIEAYGTPPSLRWCHSATVYRDKFISIFGGYDPQTREFLDDLFCFNLTTSEWSRPETRGESPVGRRSHSAFTHNELILVFAGTSHQDSNSNDLFSYDPHTCKWKEVNLIGMPSSPRDDSGCIALDGRIFIFGGSDKNEYVQDTLVLEIGL